MIHTRNIFKWYYPQMEISLNGIILKWAYLQMVLSSIGATRETRGEKTWVHGAPL